MSSCVGNRRGNVDGRTQARRDAGGVGGGSDGKWELREPCRAKIVR